MVHSGIRFATLRERLMKSVNTRVFRHTRSAALTLHLPLRRLALCLVCEACFEIGIPSCPACGGDTWVLLAKFLVQGPLKVLPQFHPFPKSWSAGPKHGEYTKWEVSIQFLVLPRDRQKLY